MIIHSRSKRKPSGGRLKSARSKRKKEIGRFSATTGIGASKRKSVRVIGGNKKIKLLTCEFANVMINNKAEKVKVKSVVDNPANKHFIRRNVITKGAILETEKGNCRVTSRPGQDGIVNAVLVK